MAGAVGSPAAGVCIRVQPRREDALPAMAGAAPRHPRPALSGGGGMAPGAGPGICPMAVEAEWQGRGHEGAAGRRRDPDSGRSIQVAQRRGRANGPAAQDHTGAAEHAGVYPADLADLPGGGEAGSRGRGVNGERERPQGRRTEGIPQGMAPLGLIGRRDE